MKSIKLALKIFYHKWFKNDCHCHHLCVLCKYSSICWKELDNEL